MAMIPARNGSGRVGHALASSTRRGSAWIAKAPSKTPSAFGDCSIPLILLVFVIDGNGFVNRRLQVRIPPSDMDKSPMFMLVSGIAIHFSALCFATGWRAPEFAEVRGFPSESAKQNAVRSCAVLKQTPRAAMGRTSRGIFFGLKPAYNLWRGTTLG